MNNYILVLGFDQDTDSIAKKIDSSIKQLGSNEIVKTFSSKWELRNWLDENAEVIIHSQPFRHDSKIFYNDTIFHDRADYEKSFYWNKYHSRQIKLFVISSCTRELTPELSDIAYDNSPFSRNILPKIPKLVLDFSDGLWCRPQTHAIIDLIRDFQQSTYHLKRNISNIDNKNRADSNIAEFITRLIKSNYNLVLETYLELIQQ